MLLLYLSYCRYVHCICYLCFCVTQVGNFPGMIATPAEWADNGPLKQRLATQVITCHYADPVTMRAIHDLLAKRLPEAAAHNTGHHLALRRPSDHASNP